MLGRVLSAWSLPLDADLDVSFETERNSPAPPQDLLRFAEKFGCDLKKVPHFIPVFSYVLFERPLPSGWKCYRDDNSREYFHNKYSGESVWISPSETLLRVFLSAASGADEPTVRVLEKLTAVLYSQAEVRGRELQNWFGPVRTDTGEEYFYNKTTQTSSWLHPATDAFWENTQMLNFARLLTNDVATCDHILQPEISNISDQLMAMVRTIEPQSEFKDKISARKARVDAEGVVYVRDVSLESSPERYLQDQFNRSMEIASQVSPIPKEAVSTPPLPELSPRKLNFGASDKIQISPGRRHDHVLTRETQPPVSVYATTKVSLSVFQEQIIAIEPVLTITEEPECPVPVMAAAIVERAVLEYTDLLTPSAAEHESRRSSTAGEPMHPFRHPESSIFKVPQTRAVEKTVKACPDAMSRSPTMESGNFPQRSQSSASQDEQRSPLRSQMRIAKQNATSPGRVGNILPSTSTGCVFFSMTAPQSRQLYDDESPSRGSPRFGNPSFRNNSN